MGSPIDEAFTAVDETRRIPEKYGERSRTYQILGGHRTHISQKCEFLSIMFTIYNVAKRELMGRYSD